MYEYPDNNELDFTSTAWESLYDAVDDALFPSQDAQLIYKSLKSSLVIRSFGDYLKRYIYHKAGLTEPFHQVPLKTYQSIIKNAFAKTKTPPSFTPTTARLSALSKNWLTQMTVKRNVVFLLGIGLEMSVENVNILLTKALLEQEINPKSPFEVICWYCIKNQYSYEKYEQLWAAYQQLPMNYAFTVQSSEYSEQTLKIRNDMLSITDESSLFLHLSFLNAFTGVSSMSFTARRHFELLYNEARDLVADIYNLSEEESHRREMGNYIQKLSVNDHFSDPEKQRRIDRMREKQKRFTRDMITASDLEHVICAAIPMDRHGNLVPISASQLNEQFTGKRFSRHRIGGILAGQTEVSRFDLITLNFFVFSQKLDQYPNPRARYTAFMVSMNQILENCFLGKIYIQNPYECFILMCILSEDPLGTYADVWEMSYSPSTSL